MRATTDPRFRRDMRPHRRQGRAARASGACHGPAPQSCGRRRRGRRARVSALGTGFGPANFDTLMSQRGAESTPRPREAPPGDSDAATGRLSTATRVHCVGPAAGPMTAEIGAALKERRASAGAAERRGARRPGPRLRRAAV